jgi:hypothetical protein
MVSNYSPVVVTIYRKKESAKQIENELVLEIPTKEFPIINICPQNEEPKRGVQVVNLYGDEKI